MTKDAAGLGVEHLSRLAASPHWEDRVRAAWLAEHERVTLPDQFPCIFEVGTDGNRDYPWVVSPDIDMLQALLPDYQALWDAFMAAFGADYRGLRKMAVGRLDGLPATKVLLPGTTPEQVLVAAIDMLQVLLPGTTPEQVLVVAIDSHPAPLDGAMPVT